MEALGAVASVLGIIAAATKTIEILGPYATASKDAPKIAAQLHSETLATRAILTALEQLGSELSERANTSTIKYAAFIQVDQFIAVLSDGVLIFDELETLLNTLPPLDTAAFLSSLQWVRKKGSLTALFTRLQAFKTSINCILGILMR